MGRPEIRWARPNRREFPMVSAKATPRSRSGPRLCLKREPDSAKRSSAPLLDGSLVFRIALRGAVRSKAIQIAAMQVCRHPKGGRGSPRLPSGSRSRSGSAKTKAAHPASLGFGWYGSIRGRRTFDYSDAFFRPMTDNAWFATLETGVTNASDQRLHGTSLPRLVLPPHLPTLEPSSALPYCALLDFEVQKLCQ